MALDTNVALTNDAEAHHSGGRPLDASRDDVLRADLAELIDRSDASTGQLDSQVIIGLVSALPHDAELREVFRTQLIDAHTATLALVFERAVARGEIRPIHNLDTIVSILPALVVHRLIVTATVPDRTC